MNYLVCQKLNGRTLEENITASLAVYRLRFEGRAPECVMVHPEQVCRHPLTVVVASTGVPVVARDTFWMPVE